MSDKDNGPLQLFDDPHAPEVFATNASGFANIGGSIVVTLECTKSDYSGITPQAARHVVSRLVMPASGAQALAVGLYDYLKSIGFDPASNAGKAN